MLGVRVSLCWQRILKMTVTTLLHPSYRTGCLKSYQLVTLKNLPGAKGTHIRCKAKNLAYLNSWEPDKRIIVTPNTMVTMNTSSSYISLKLYIHKTFQYPSFSGVLLTLPLLCWVLLSWGAELQSWGVEHPHHSTLHDIDDFLLGSSWDRSCLC